MADMRAQVKQQNDSIEVDGPSFLPLKMTRDHALQVNSREALVDMWTRDGRVFISGTPAIGTPETMSAAGTAFTLTAPSLRFTIPSGVIVVPISVEMQIATVIAKSDLFGVLVSDTDTFTSGGEAMQAARNALIQSNEALRQTGVTNLLHSDTAIVEAALTRPRILKTLKRQGQLAELNTTWNPEYNILKGDQMVYIVGPASFLVFAVQETTAAEATWSMSWAELDADTVG